MIRFDFIDQVGHKPHASNYKLIVVTNLFEACSLWREAIVGMKIFSSQIK
jgi:hypothetical protein